LEQHLPLTSRRKIRKLLDGGEVFVNAKRIWLAKFQVRKGDTIIVLNPTRKEGKLQREAILFQNEDFLIIDKPAGAVVEDSTGTFPVLRELGKLGYTGLRLVHRLDKETSGLLLLAKNHATRQQLVANWMQVQKTYLAICLGKCPQTRGIINTPVTPCSA
jgi:23S rRNA pseudouridine1911/1915/1917 synthase